MQQYEAYKDSLTWWNKLSRALWNIFRVLFFRPFGGPLFQKWRVFVLKLWGAKIGVNCAINQSAIIWAPWNLVCGQQTAIGAKAQIYNVDKIIIGDKVTISQGVFVCTASHDIRSINKPLITKPISIESFSWVCADAFIRMGVTIGEGSVVGARAAVFKDVEPWTVVGGNPAVFIKKRVIKDPIENE
ncbi:MAG: putative colanic acid biosynthesis acetyltransferase [Bacteroidales bacterium]|nr:putative colanic acid biosynthesis acetyltransferase [Bacteroidales bacterium]